MSTEQNIIFKWDSLKWLYSRGKNTENTSEIKVENSQSFLMLEILQSVLDTIVVYSTKSVDFCIILQLHFSFNSESWKVWMNMIIYKT